MTQRNDRPASGPRETPSAGELTSGETRLRVRGCALELVLWIARHQSRINEAAPEGGQLILNWKGIHSQSITGEIKTRL